MWQGFGSKVRWKMSKRLLFLVTKIISPAASKMRLIALGFYHTRKSGKQCQPCNKMRKMKQAVFKTLPKNPLHLSSHGELYFIMSNKRQCLLMGVLDQTWKRLSGFLCVVGKSFFLQNYTKSISWKGDNHLWPAFGSKVGDKNEKERKVWHNL